MSTGALLEFVPVWRIHCNCLKPHHQPPSRRPGLALYIISSFTFKSSCVSHHSHEARWLTLSRILRLVTILPLCVYIQSSLRALFMLAGKPSSLAGAQAHIVTREASVVYTGELSLPMPVGAPIDRTRRKYVDLLDGPWDTCCLSRCILCVQMHPMCPDASYVSGCVLCVRMHPMFPDASYVSGCILRV